MNVLLTEMLNKLETELNPDEQKLIEAQHMNALNWEPVDRLPLIVTFPYPESIPVQPFPHREILKTTEKPGAN